MSRFNNLLLGDPDTVINELEEADANNMTTPESLSLSETRVSLINAFHRIKVLEEKIKSLQLTVRPRNDH